MRWSIKRTVEPAVEPVSLAEAKVHLKMDDVTADDALIAALISAAREWVEQATRRALITQTWRFRCNELPPDERLPLPRPPLQSVTTFAYVDDGGSTSTWSSSKYTVLTDAEPGIVAVNYGEVWPSIRDQEDAVTVTYVAGYGSTPSLVPAPLRQAILLLVGAMYANREATAAVKVETVPFGVEALISPYRVHYF